jgi:hypothetical protein
MTRPVLPQSLSENVVVGAVPLRLDDDAVLEDGTVEKLSTYEFSAVVIPESFVSGSRKC